MFDYALVAATNPLVNPGDRAISVTFNQEAVARIGLSSYQEEAWVGMDWSTCVRVELVRAGTVMSTIVFHNQNVADNENHVCNIGPASATLAYRRPNNIFMSGSMLLQHGGDTHNLIDSIWLPSGGNPNGVVPVISNFYMVQNTSQLIAIEDAWNDLDGDSTNNNDALFLFQPLINEVNAGGTTGSAALLNYSVRVISDYNLAGTCSEDPTFIAGSGEQVGINLKTNTRRLTWDE